MQVPRLNIAPKYAQGTRPDGVQGPYNEDGTFNTPANNGDPFIGGAPGSTDPYNSDSEILYFLSKEKNALIFIAIIVALVVGLYIYLR